MKNTEVITISAEEFADLNESYGGICIECHDQAYDVEPDARRYRCEACGENAVYGVEELLIRGLIEFAGERAKR